MSKSNQEVFDTQIQPLLRRLQLLCRQHDMPYLVSVMHTVDEAGNSVEFYAQRVPPSKVSSTLFVIGNLIKYRFEHTNPLFMRRLARLIVDATTPPGPTPPSISQDPPTLSKH